MSKHEWMAVATIAAFLVAGIVFFVHIAQENSDKYAVVCEQSGGKPVFNGRFWECIK